jgi:hypothetical protein
MQSGREFFSRPFAFEHQFGYAFTADQLIKAPDIVRADPVVIGRHRERVDVTTVFRSDRRVCVRRSAWCTGSWMAPWLTPLEATWRHAYGRKFWLGASERLRHSRELTGAEALHEQFKAFCTRTP